MANRVVRIENTKTFLRNCQKPVTTGNPLDESATGFAAIPYIQGVTEPTREF